MDFAELVMLSRRSWQFKVICCVVLCLILISYYVILRRQRSPLNEIKFNDDRTSASLDAFGNLLIGYGLANSVFQIPRNDPRGFLKEKIIHLDFKGMHPSVDYLENLLPLFVRVGVTGLLIEYEDTFPFRGSLKSLRSHESYSESDIKQINQLAETHKLEIIPLVQTFGHLEFLLKLEEFVQLREVLKYPQSICPSNNQSFLVIQEMIRQVMKLHPNTKRFHIGADEVYQIGLCPLCSERAIRNRWSNVELFLDHVVRVARNVIDSYGVRPMMWDDEFRSADEYLVAKYGIGSLVDIVVWNYKKDVELPADLWSKYKGLFKSVWVGSAFKGAEEPNSIVVNETLYIGNHMSWLREVQAASSIHFKGIILTGWQRFDHFAVPCEILPVAIPSLVTCLMLMNPSNFMSPFSAIANASQLLDCSSPLEYCRFPGSEIHTRIRQLSKLKRNFRNLKSSNIFKGWMHPENLRASYSSPHYLNMVYSDLFTIYTELQTLKPALETSLAAVFRPFSVQEWMLIHFQPFWHTIEEMFDNVNIILEKVSFRRRPVRYKLSIQQQYNDVKRNTTSVPS